MWVQSSGGSREVSRCLRKLGVLAIILILARLPVAWGSAAVESAGPDQDEKPCAEQPASSDEVLPEPKSLAQSGLTLDQAINLCLVNDPKLRAGFEAINQATADALTASLKPNPELFTDIQLLPLTRPFTVDAQGGPPQQDVMVTYPIDWFIFGKRAAGMASAKLEVQVSEAEFADLVRQRVLEVAVAFYDVLEARGLHDVARRDVENLQRVEAATDKAVKAGGRPAVELARVRLDLVRSRQILRDAEAQLVNTKAKLRALLGGQVSGTGFDLAGNLEAPVTVEPLPVENAFELADQNRPDVHALRWKISKAQADTRVEQRKACPEVKATFGYTRQYQTKAIGFPDANSWSAAVEMSLPLFDRNQGNRAKAASVVAQSNFDLQSSLLDLRAEIEQVVQEFSTARANAQAVEQEQLKLAGEVRDSINKAYEAGGRPLLDVLDAQRNYRETYRLYISSRANYWRALHRFNAAVGKQVFP